MHTRLSYGPRPDLLMAKRMSIAAQQAATDANIGWLDETGAAQFAVGTIVVSRTSVPVPQTAKSVKRWTPATLGITAPPHAGEVAVIDPNGRSSVDIRTLT